MDARESNEVQDLIVRMARENILWRALRIDGEALMLGFSVSQAKVAMQRRSIGQHKWELDYAFDWVAECAHPVGREYWHSRALFWRLVPWIAKVRFHIGQKSLSSTIGLLDLLYLANR